MRLEDLTKIELIKFIRKNLFLLCTEEKYIVSDAMFKRMRIISDKQKAASDEYFSYLAEYSEILKPYEGELISTIPDEVIHKAMEIGDKIKSSRKKIVRLDNEYKKLSDEVRK